MEQHTSAKVAAGRDVEWEHEADFASGVHILYTRSSRNQPGGNSSAGTGRKLRPHRRRGYWRRQRYGPGNRSVKWVRIPPTIVNAHRGPLGWQVYQLAPTA
jgi:hypothetical protein